MTIKNYAQNYPHGNIHRVTQKQPCRICGKPDWCGISADEEVAFCARKPNLNGKRAGAWGWSHYLFPYSHSATKTQVSAATAKPIDNGGSGEQKRADADRRNEVYTYLLEWCLGLNVSHRDQLFNKRGLSIATVAENLYASLPNGDEWLGVCRAMQKRFGDKLHGVSGFYKSKREQWLMRRFSDGFFVPYRDAQGRIVGLQIRLDKPRGNEKYIWFSTPKLSQGASSGSPVHFTRPDLVKQSGYAVLTEGALKADIVSERLNVTAIGIAGAASVNAEHGLAEIRRQLPGLKSVAVAFDADWTENEAVMGGLERMLLALDKSNLETEVLEWNIAEGKGLDDVLNFLQTTKGN